MAINQRNGFQEILDEVPAVWSDQLAEAYILGMQDMERFYGYNKTTGNIIAWTIDETEARIATRKASLKEGIDL